MLLCRKVRLVVSEQDAATLEMMQGKCRGLYNWWVMKLRAGQRWNWQNAKKTLAESRKVDPDINQVYGKLLAEVYFRLDKAMQAFFKRVANGRGRFYHIGGFNGARWYNKQLDKIRSKRSRCQKKSRRYVHLSQVYKRVSERKRNKRQDCLHKASALMAYKLVERTMVIGDLSQRQMATKEHTEHHKALHRAVYNDWGVYAFVQILKYKCALAGKALEYIDEHDSSKMCSRCGHQQPMPLYQRTYRCQSCGLVMDRDENSAVNHYQRFFARLGPHVGDPVRCADVFTAIDTFKHV